MPDRFRSGFGKDRLNSPEAVACLSYIKSWSFLLLYCSFENWPNVRGTLETLDRRAVGSKSPSPVLSVVPTVPPLALEEN